MEKLNAITRVSVGGESKASVARDIGVPESTLRGWCKNHDKISYQVKTISSPTNDTIDDASESFTVMSKRIKLESQAIEQPYNLSIKSDISDGSYSPESVQNHTLEGEFPQPAIPERDANTSPLNLTKTVVTEKTLSDKEKNKAELAKLSAQLGLNRPEVKPVLNQWMDMINLCQQQQGTKLPKVSPPATGLLTTVDKREKLHHQYQSRVEQTPSVYDSVSFWLRQQPYSSNPQVPFLPLVIPSTSSATNVTNTATSASNGDASFLSADNASQMRNLQMNLFYQQNFQIAQLQAAAAIAASTGQANPSQPILYQQLTKECEREVNSENKTKETIEEHTKEENKTVEDNKPKNGTKNRSVLDNLPLNNNVNDTKEDVEPVDAFEALEHGEKFLSWLEHCSDPAVTSWQLNTVQNLIKNLKNSFERRTHPGRIKKIRK